MSNISYRQNIIDKIDQQIAKGKSKYGQVLEDNDLTMDEKLDHLQEELVDALFYIEHLREESNNKKEVKFREPKMVCLKIDNEHKLVNDVIAINCDLPSQLEQKEDIVYVVFNYGYITFDGVLQEIKTMEDDKNE